MTQIGSVSTMSAAKIWRKSLLVGEVAAAFAGDAVQHLFLEHHGNKQAGEHVGVCGGDIAGVAVCTADCTDQSLCLNCSPCVSPNNQMANGAENILWG